MGRAVSGAPSFAQTMSPCQGACVIRQSTGLCQGCGRSVPEITDWRQFSAEKRAAINQRLTSERVILENIEQSKEANTEESRQQGSC